MTCRLVITPITLQAGIYPVTLTLGKILEKQGLKVRHAIPIVDLPAPSSAWDAEGMLTGTTEPLPFLFARHLMSRGRKEELLEFIVAFVKKGEKGEDVTLIHGCETLGNEMGVALSGEVIFVAAPHTQSVESFSDEIQIKMCKHHPFGLIVNCLDSSLNWSESALRMELGKLGIRVLGVIPPDPRLKAPRVKDLATFLEADIICGGSEGDRRVEHFEIVSSSFPHIVDSIGGGTLLICHNDPRELESAIELVVEKEISIAAILILGKAHLDLEMKRALQGKLPILTVSDGLWQVVMKLHSFDTALIPLDDQERISKTCATMQSHIDPDFARALSLDSERRISPQELRFQLLEKAKQAKKKIVLPEGTDPRILKAANLCERRKIAHCILLGCPNVIERVAHQEGIALEQSLEIIDPTGITPNYVDPLVALRRHKGMNKKEAKSALSDPMMLGTMMLSEGDVDGLVGGACTTTARTIIPALQVIKTTPSAKLASSLFFMCLKEGVLLYADCAVNVNPTAEELADIAIQSAITALAFGITPRIAMISYSTGHSGKGAEVEKVKAATQLIKEMRPDLLIDGPLQYDAALSPSIAKQKAPKSPLAGNATLCIFPNLSTGNVTYKAVQQSSEILSIGPILQGLNKPVNDVSRGASVDDILYTIAVTAIQATLT